ncbi:3-hydroxyisobutyrate dehydrogenase [Defluviimonas sp. 20V17]|uniref:L-threonate dehydrogenase n=2 Tax=Allgaiera indica TaxID=765699 RepID=A0AAN5A095_9RHOB|nr:3-hydroxyisobutyrate dehydrogenase [Defluviimonas sp. 20V17]GHE03712.1 3-hydroxyisobutyrate dehydrogenase [Allgaiera indica]SDX74042.1 3-hydroxyisobutyrate dehydrogenase/2-hydroxy-3-oxopropionate reductase [Allgaiera indica]
MAAQKIGVIGLGSMGLGIARSLLRAGHRVWGHDLNPAQVVRLRDEGAEAETPRQAAARLDALVSVVLNAAQTEAILFGPEGIAPHLPKGTVVLSCATVPPDFARDMARRCADLGLHYLDAPISGGAVKAAAGELTIMASGPGAAFDAAEPVLKAIAASVFRLGEAAGAGSAMKAVNQMLAGIHIAAMAEALTFGLTQGVAPETFLAVISKSAGTSWMLENRAPHVIAGDYTPRSSIDIWPKDLGIVLDIARAAGFPAPITEAALARFQDAAAQGLGAEDDAAVVKVYARAAGLALPGEDA